jgi:hypothetical protein
MQSAGQADVFFMRWAVLYNGVAEEHAAAHTDDYNRQAER